MAYTQDIKGSLNIVVGVDAQNLPQAVAEIPWGHNVLLLEKVKDLHARFWYIHKTLEYGWSRSVLWHHIDTKLYERQFEVEKATNFNLTLPSPQSDLAREVLKDPYNFDFLTLAKDSQEKDLEKGLLEHIREFLLELEVGFAFMSLRGGTTKQPQKLEIPLNIHMYYSLWVTREGDCFVVPPRNDR